MQDRIFSGMYPTGIVWSDREVIEHNDYKRLAFLSYATLALDIESDCPDFLRDEIIADAKRFQDKKGEYIEYTRSGQKILLGYALCPEKHIYIAVVSYHYNIPSMQHTRTIEIEAYNSEEAEDTVRKMFPHITGIAVIRG